ncbi:MAG: preprotein translocase subunit SecE [Alphaproteobacteria bacterium]|nr:preprotein translocase subunit SecE [Alphaproteobacteria bacterium]MDA7982913.1 preprotein translocase subunit SecE [Alphaproteobacteria bacterium]MDA7983940.1 preprotein translocase subunit SecE [Alphaproteobacteria bacterium]MDA7986903.1 preprotein translocase subunit SecE [Alphaproteobacteria bacterium]MDA7988394.1 preprotein translocase subunit SecE [Alphaproteobacteria bacterium]
MAVINPGKFVREVRREIVQVTWPTRRETVISTIMVFVMVALASVFFLLVDQIFSWIIQIILRLG